MLLTTRVIILATASFCCAQAASTKELCTELGGSVDDWAQLPGSPDCDVTGKAGHCRWTFAFRAPEAQALFSQLVDGAACWDLERDEGVNHPDSYDAVLVSTANGAVRISIKDKAALGQTLVFVSR